jgi:5'-phosphate synthase pdxT subunit
MLGIPACEVRTQKELMRDELTGLILPGGESTVVSKFLDEFDLRSHISARAENSAFKIYGTCAGLILLAKNVLENGTTSSRVKPLGLLDIDVERNAYGRQMGSFLTEFGAFIRAPRITRIADGVEVVQKYEDTPVLVRRGSIWGSTFHPELTKNARVHRAIFL